MMDTYRTFATLQDARNYRHDNGTGGWIFHPENDSTAIYPLHQSILFPPEFTPNSIFNHPFTRGRNGKLIGT